MTQGEKFFIGLVLGVIVGLLLLSSPLWGPRGGVSPAITMSVSPETFAGARLTCGEYRRVPGADQPKILLDRGNTLDVFGPDGAWELDRRLDCRIMAPR